MHRHPAAPALGGFLALAAALVAAAALTIRLPSLACCRFNP